MQIPLLAICQQDYPQKIVWNKDTVCIISISQVKKVNSTFIKLDFQKELNDSLFKLNRMLLLAVNKQKQITSSYESQLQIKKEVIELNNEFIDQLKIREEKALKQNKLLKWQRNGLLVISVILGTLLYIK